MELPTEIPSIIPSVIKKYYYQGIYQRNGVNKFIFLLPMDLPTEKKLPTKDSPTEHFRR